MMNKVSAESRENVFGHQGRVRNVDICAWLYPILREELAISDNSVVLRVLSDALPSSGSPEIGTAGPRTAWRGRIV